MNIGRYLGRDHLPKQNCCIIFSVISRVLAKLPLSLGMLGDEEVLGEPTLACRDLGDGELKLFFCPSTEK